MPNAGAWFKGALGRIVSWVETCRMVSNFPHLVPQYLLPRRHRCEHLENSIPTYSLLCPQPGPRKCWERLTEERHLCTRATPLAKGYTQRQQNTQFCSLTPGKPLHLSVSLRVHQKMDSCRAIRGMKCKFLDFHLCLGSKRQLSYRAQPIHFGSSLQYLSKDPFKSIQPHVLWLENSPASGGLS